MKKLNVVLAATGVSSLACDFYLQEVSQRLRKRGHKVWLLQVNPEKTTKDNIPVYWQEPKWKLLWLLYILCPYLKDRAVSQLVADALNKIKTPINIVNFEIPSLAYCYQKKGGEKIIVRGWFHPHNLLSRLKIMYVVGPPSPIKKFIFLLRQTWFYIGDECGFKRADHIVTLTEKLSFQLSKRGFKATCVPLGIEVKEYRKRIMKKPVRFGTIAYDLENPRKGIDYLLEAVKILEKTDLPHDSYTVELIGGYTEKLKEKIRRLGLEEKIKLLGRLDHSQVVAKLQKWDVFIFPTLFEEFGMVAIEAMAAELTVIGWKIDALRATCGNTGILLPKGNVKLLAKALAKLINSPNLRKKVGYQSWQRAKKYFDWETVVSRLEKVYLHPTG